MTHPVNIVPAAERAKFRANRYGGRCHTCARGVRAGEGYLTGKMYSSRTGKTSHVLQCPDCTHIPPCNGTVRMDDPLRREFDAAAGFASSIDTAPERTVAAEATQGALF